MRLSNVVLGVAAAAVLSAAAARTRAAEPYAVRPTYLDQGPAWTAADRTAFYTTDQGSEIMPIAWARALTTRDGTPFFGDRLARYGYLEDPSSPYPDLPVGFTAATRSGVVRLGMTCAACHTRQIQVDQTSYRIDGGPALSDFQTFLADLDDAVGRTLSSDGSFRSFSAGVLGATASDAARAALRQDVAAWYRRQHALFSRALPTEPWGVGRLDAVSMILNRVSGLDIGTSTDGVIEGNIMPADAPVRYPFIWDAPRQDHTQWPGFADNGDVLLSIARNLGEVYGVFADFHPVRDGSLLGYDFHSRNSASFDGLDNLERLVRRIGAPKWPWPTDPAAVARGSDVFQRQCSGCHGEAEGTPRLLPFSRTWRTSLVDAGTDVREYDVLNRNGDTGVLKGAGYGIGRRLKARDHEFNILAASVVGSMLDRFTHHLLPVDSLVQPIKLGVPLPSKAVATSELNGAYHPEVLDKPKAGSHPYEARVLHGIWSAAPYLHNGSVASLRELLLAPERRKAAFAVGPVFDPGSVGLAAIQPATTAMRRTTACDDLRSGNSRCGHRYGTDLPEGDKADLLEFLKTY